MNKTLWNYYKQSADGQKAMHLFEPQPENVYENIEAIATFVKKLDSDINPQQFSDMVFIHEINFAERYSIGEETFNRDTTNTTF